VTILWKWTAVSWYETCNIPVLAWGSQEKPCEDSWSSGQDLFSRIRTYTAVMLHIWRWGKCSTQVTTPCVSLLYIHLVWGCYLSFWSTFNTRPHGQGNVSIYNNVLNTSFSKSNGCSKVKAKVIPQQTMSYTRRRGLTHSITVNLGTRCRRVIIFTSQSLHLPVPVAARSIA
jgi:hypothetical protein